jgi:hypothetical protein
MIFREDGARTVCTGGTESFDYQVECDEILVTGDRVRFGMPFGGGVIFDLKISGGLLTGTLRSKPGVRDPPFNWVELKKTGALTLSDQLPRLE